MVFGALALALVAPLKSAFAAEDFSVWLTQLRQDAVDQGISQRTIQSGLTSIEPIPRIIELDRQQPETVLTFSQYLKTHITPLRVREGRAAYASHRSLLKKISAQYGVPPEIILALWGMETSYGQNIGGYPTVTALATLAYDGRRSEFFRDELIKALKILDEGDIGLSNMKGSWAGAMGQNQFMPSSFFKFAVDGDDNGRRDIWKSLPDIFASTANYLNKSGWKEGNRWGRRVWLSENIPNRMLGMDVKKPIQEWKHMGVTLAGGKSLPTVKDGTYASLIKPDGPHGPAYLVYDNFRVIMKWNHSIYFAASVGMLADEIAK